jgi:chemotaxis protein MotB
MTTFGDLIMLLLTFFVLLLTMKSMDAQLIKSMFDDLSESSGPLEFERSFGDGSSASGKGLEPHPEPIISQEAVEEILALMESVERLEAGKMPVDQLKRFLKVGEDQRGVVLSLDADQLFYIGEAKIQRERLLILDRISDLLYYSSNDILVMGHTDNQPLRRGDFASNWELSVHRALSVYDYLISRNKLSSQRMAVGGYGSSRPLVSNTSEGNRAKNRRVEFILRRPVTREE